ncbi:hypothetical protein ACE103_11055 [Bradyrhizobium sp. ma5]|uniref:hypothetical protein n=1 Tax=Bradyrhizobium sp. ma5 TaxID=3344828 RepID=UPI0035D3DAE4
MSKHVVVALTNPIRGREADYNRWFERAHIPEILSVPGFLSARRFEVADNQIGPTPVPYKYLTVYEVETPDLGATLVQLGKTVQSGTKTDSSDVDRRAIWVYAPMSDNFVAGG